MKSIHSKLLTAALIAVMIALLASCSPEAEPTATSATTDMTLTDEGSRIGSHPIGSFTVYGDSLTDDDYAFLTERIMVKTGASLKKGTKDDKHLITFAEDDSLKLLEYRITVSDGKLTVSAHDKYYIPYLPAVLADYFDSLDEIALPDGFSLSGAIELDDAGYGSDDLNYICETDKNPLTYKPGESVTFRIIALSGMKAVAVPQLMIEEYDEEGGMETTVLPCYTGTAYYTHPGINIPGEIYIKATAQHENGVTMHCFGDIFCEAAVLYAADEIRPTLPKPDDFDAYWDKKIAEITSFTPVEEFFKICRQEKQSGFTVYCVGIDAGRTNAYFHVTVPENYQAHSLGLRFKYAGHGMPSSRGSSAEDGFITVTPSNFDVPNHASQDVYDECYERLGEDFGFDCAYKPTDECYFYDLIARDIQIIEYVKAKFSDAWNGKDLVLSGGSMGGYQTIAVGALCGCATELDISYPWCSDMYNGDLPKKSELYYNIQYTDTSKYLDGSYFAERITGKVSISTGFGDTECRVKTVMSVYNSLINAESKTISCKQCQTHPYHGGNNESFRVPEGSTAEAVNPFTPDTGAYLPAPTYSDDRELTASEKVMSECVSRLADEIGTYKYRVEGGVYPNEQFIADVYEVLVTKCGLPEGTAIELDYNTFDAMLDKAGKYKSFSVDLGFILRDADGGHVSGTVKCKVGIIQD